MRVLDRDAAAALIDALAAVLALPVDAAHREGTVENLVRILTVGGLVTEFPLPEEIEVAPVFRP